jgi:hypothetical protein
MNADDTDLNTRGLVNLPIYAKVQVRKGAVIEFKVQ